MKTLTPITAAMLAAATLLAGLAPARTAAQTVVTAPESATLTVRFEGITEPNGRILMSLFDSEAAYDADEKPVQVAAVAIQGDTATVSFAGLAPGRYAIKTFHDVDGDGQLKTNPFGMPLEPFAFSNNARPQGGPASWQAASFQVQAGASETRISFK